MLFSYCAAVAPRGTASNHQSHSRCNSIVAGVDVDVDDVDVDDVIVSVSYNFLTTEIRNWKSDTFRGVAPLK
jgi:hypothetical protein